MIVEHTEFGQCKAELETLLTALRELAAWPQSVPWHPSITSQDIPMRERAAQAISAIGRNLSAASEIENLKAEIRDARAVHGCEKHALTMQLGYAKVGLERIKRAIRNSEEQSQEQGVSAFAMIPKAKWTAILDALEAACPCCADHKSDVGGCHPLCECEHK